MNSEHSCLTCGDRITKKPGRGRWPWYCSARCKAAARKAAGKSPNPQPRPRINSESARRATSARMSAVWAEVPMDERKSAASRAATARWDQWRLDHGPTRPTRWAKLESPAGMKPCEHCGENSVRNIPRVRFCGGVECVKARNRERQGRYGHERRARLRGGEWERFKPSEIFDRDGWTCGFCGLPVDANLSHPDPLSVSLDHIEPLSLGGAHSRENTRCAHLGCNVRRGNRAA